MGRSAARIVVVLAVVTLLRSTCPVAAAPEGTMTWGVHITLASRWLDPAETEGIITPFMVLYGLHDALVKPMPAGQQTPSLADSWTAGKDGLTYEFVIRRGVKFHNGDPVTPADVKFSFERYRGAGAKLLKERVREIQIIDPGRVRFVLKEPWPDFMTFYGTSATGAGWIVPKAYVEKVGEDGFKKAPIGAGPYKFVSFSPGVELVMEAWDGYWRKVPNVKRLVLRSLPEETTRAAALKKGEIDIAYLLTGPVAEDLYPWPPYFSMGEALAGYLQNVGIRTKIRTMERAAMTTAWREKKLKNVIVGITGAAGNAATRLDAYVSRNGIYTSGVMPDVEDLFQRQARETDVKKREALVHQIQDILRERVTHIPLYELAFISGVGPRVEEPGINLLRSFAYSGPLAYVRLKR